MKDVALVFKNVYVPNDSVPYTIRIEASVEFLNEDEDDDDCHMDFVSSVWDIKEIRLTDYTRHSKASVETSWGVGFSLVDNSEYKKVADFVSSFDFAEMVYDRIASGNTGSEIIYGDYWL
jgi:hypothetical protein